MFIEAKDDGGGGDNWSYKSCKTPVKSSPTNNNNVLSDFSEAVQKKDGMSRNGYCKT